MSVIGIFKPSKEGGWEGNLRTLGINERLRLVPNDDRSSDDAPAFRVMLGRQRIGDAWEACTQDGRSEEHTSELQSLMRISYAVFCLKKKKNNKRTSHYHNTNCTH